MFCTVLRPNSGYSPTQLHVTAHTTERKCVYCAVRNKSLNVVQVNLSLKKVISMSSVFTWKLTSLRKLPLTTSSICSTISLLSPFNFRTGPISAAVPYTYIYISWRWKQYITLKPWSSPSRLHGVTHRMTTKIAKRLPFVEFKIWYPGNTRDVHTKFARYAQDPPLLYLPEGGGSCFFRNVGKFI